MTSASWAKRVEGGGGQFGVIQVNAELVLNVNRQVNQAEGIDQPAGQQRLVGAQDFVGLLENFGGDVRGEGGLNVFGHAFLQVWVVEIIPRRKGEAGVGRNEMKMLPGLCSAENDVKIIFSTEWG